MNGKSREFSLILLFWALAGTSALLFLVTELWDSAPEIVEESRASDRTGISLVMIFGAIGGFIRWMHFLREIDRNPKRRGDWFVTSLLTPLMGSALSLVFCIALRAGLTTHHTAGKDAVNWLGLYALAGMIGIFSPDAVRRLQEMFRAAIGMETGNSAKTAGDSSGNVGSQDQTSNGESSSSSHSQP